MALQLQKRGIDARPLAGGYRAWLERYPVEPKQGFDDITIPGPE